MIESLSLFGGPLHRLGCRLGLVHGTSNSVPLGLAIGFGLWMVLVALTLIEGVQDSIFSISAIGGHVRLLVVIPLFFVCEALLGDRPALFIRTIVDAQIVAPQDVPALEAEVARINRLKDAWQPEAVCLLLTALSPLLYQQVSLPGATAAYHPEDAGPATLTPIWYWLVCMPVFRFLLLRWIWRLALWSHLLWRVSRIELQLTPTHPDGAGGIGYLEAVQTKFAPLVMAISAVFAAAFAESIAAGTKTFESIYVGFLVILLANILLFFGPLAVFTPKLVASRGKGLVDYMVFAGRYLKDFERTRVRPDVDPAAAPLAAADVQSLADMLNVVNGARRMRLIPAGLPLLTTLGLAAFLPFVPLGLLRYPVPEMAARFVQMLFGL